MAKSSKTAGKVKERCPECGGGKRGRGFSHAESCSSFKPKAGGSGGGGGIDGRSLRAMSVGALLELRGKVDEALENRAPEIDAEIERVKASATAEIERLKSVKAEIGKK